MRNGRLAYIGLLALGLLSFALLNWVYDYVLVFQRQGGESFFIFSRQFLLGFLDRPGDLVRYAGRFLGQFYQHTWLAALITSALITSFGVLFHLVLRRLTQTVSILRTFLPCILVLALHTSTMHLVQDTAGFVATLAAFLGYLCLRRGFPRHTYALVVTPALYLLLGGYVWFFIVWVTASEWSEAPLRSHLVFKVVYPVLSVCIPFAAWRWFFHIPLRTALMYPGVLFVTFVVIPCVRGGFTNSTFFVGTYSFLAVTLSAYLLLAPFWGRIRWGGRLGAFWRPKRGKAVQVALLIELAVFALFLLYIQYDPKLKELIDYSQLYEGRQWGAILAKARKHPSRRIMVQFFTDRALCEKGRLLDEMFQYPQTWGTRGLVLNFSRGEGYEWPDTDMNKAMYNSDLFFAMGHMNAAFRIAYDHFSATGGTYHNVKRIVECNMVNGNDQIAEKYLNMLGKTLFHRAFAERHRRIIADPAEIETPFAELRARAPTVERNVFLGNYDALLSLVRSNAQNRMAFDYLTAWCLLDKTSLPVLAENMRHLREAGYTSMPPYCQEALMILAECSGVAVDTHGFTYDGRTASRFRAFVSQMWRYRSRRAAQRGLRSAFGRTYMYYYFLVGAPGRGGHAPAHWRLGSPVRSQARSGEPARRFHEVLRIGPDSAKTRENGVRIRGPRTH